MFQSVLNKDFSTTKKSDFKLQFGKLPYFNFFFFSFSQVHACKVKNTNLYGSLMKPLHELREFFIFRACTADWGSQLFQFIQLLHLQFGGQSPAFTPATLNQSNLFILLDRCPLSSDALSVGSSWSLATVWIWMVVVVSVLRIDGYSDQVGKFQPHPNFTPILLACILLRWFSSSLLIKHFLCSFTSMLEVLHKGSSLTPITHPFTHHWRPIKNKGFKSKLLWLFLLLFWITTTS